MLKLSFKTNDESLNHLLTEIEDAVSTREETDKKQDKIEKIVTTEPSVKSMVNGDRQIFYDGTSYWEYIKAGGKLFKYPLIFAGR